MPSRPTLNVFMDAYEVLGVGSASSPLAIRHAYKRQLRHASVEQLRSIESAYRLVREAPLRHHRVSTGAEPDRPWTDDELEHAWRLAQLENAMAYVVAQFVGGALGVLAASLTLRGLIADPATRFAVTLPGPAGLSTAFVAELAITFVLMTVILHVSNHPTRAHLTGLCAGALVAVYITVEAPLSGMSMNPARTLASALFARDWTALWIYFTAPPLGMLLAAELYLRRRGAAAVFCAKLHHRNEQPCIFCEARRSSGADGTFLQPASLYPPTRHHHAT